MSKKLTQQQLGVAGGVSRAAVAQWENGDTKNLRPDNLFRIAACLGCDARWLATGHESGVEQTEPGPDLGDTRSVPVVGTTQAGPDGRWEDLGYPTDYGNECLDVFLKDASCYALRVKGNSMAPRIKEGEVIIVSRNAEPVGGDEVVLKLTNGQVMVKTFLSQRAGQLTVQCIINGERYVYLDDEITFMHAVLGIHLSRVVRKR